MTWTPELLAHLCLAATNYLEVLLNEAIISSYQLFQVLLSQRCRNFEQDMLLQRLIQRRDIDPSSLLELAKIYNDLDALIWIHDLLISRIPLPEIRSELSAEMSAALRPR